jgi:transcriptional regulator with XRE-family HTH domain
MDTDDRLDLAAQLRAAVAETGESLYAVAKRAGISYAILHRFMAGKRSINLETADQISKALGLTLSSSGKLVKAASPPEIKPQLAARMLDRAFGGALDRLMASALAHRPPSSAEIARLQALLAELDAKKKGSRKP